MTNKAKVFTGSLFLLFSAFVCATPLKVGISLVDLSNPFFAILAQEISDGIKQNYDSESEIYVNSSAYNLQRQVNQLEQYLQSNVDIIFIAASQSAAIAPVIEKARDLGVIVVAVDIESAGADISVTSDNVQAGQSACEYLAHYMKEAGQVAIINGQPISSVTLRVQGCKEALSRFPNIKLVSEKRYSSGTFSGGLESMTYLLLEYPTLDGVFAINDVAAMGALEAAQQLNNTNVRIVSVDGSPEFKKQLKSGQNNLLASSGQFPVLMAKRAVELALEKLEDKSVSHRFEYIQTELITKENTTEVSNW